MYNLGDMMNPDIIDIPKEDGSLSSNRINLDTNTIIIYDEINDHLAKEISDNINNMGKNTAPLIIKISSPGGYVSSTITIVSELMSYPEELEIIVDITGVCYSGAAIIALAGDHIRMSKFGSYMLHYPHWGSDEQTLNEHKLETKIAEREFDRLCLELLKRTKITPKEYKEKMKANMDWFLTADEAKKLGIVDEVY